MRKKSSVRHFVADWAAHAMVLIGIGCSSEVAMTAQSTAPGSGATSTAAASAAVGGSQAPSAPGMASGAGGPAVPASPPIMPAMPTAPVAGSAAGNRPPAPEPPPEPVAAEPLDPFSFFVTSLSAMRELSGSQDGFGGDLRFGETGENAGLRGADKICATIAGRSMPGAESKPWRAFLSATAGGADGGPVHAIDRIGKGPWYDRLGRVVAENTQQLLDVRPTQADAMIKNDLPNEDGVPNQDPDGTGRVDNHDTLTGSNAMGQLAMDDPLATCDDWTKSQGDEDDAPQVGHSWPREIGGGGGNAPGGAGGGRPGFSPNHWIQAHSAPGCAPGVTIVEAGGPRQGDPTVGGGGGYGGIYCFSMTP
jgi:hypothetical protein